MKNLLFAGLAGVLASMPGTAFAASDSAPGTSAPIDLSFASPAAIAASSQGMKAPRMKMGGHKMRGGGMKMRGNKMRGGGMKMRGNKMRGQGMKMRGRQMRGQGMRNRGHNGKRFRGNTKNRGFRGNRGGNFGFVYGGGFPSLGYSSPTILYTQPSYQYTQPQPSYYPAPYPVPVPVAVPAPAPTTVIVETVAPKGKGLTKPAHRIASQTNHPVAYDHNVITADERVISAPYPGGPVAQAGTTYQGDWNGAYQQDGSYQGQWQGTYRDAEGQSYQGQYSGTFIGDGNAVPAGANYAQQAPQPQYRERGYDDRGYDGRNEELAYLERCKKSSGIGGAVVGGAIGALAGNRIAGRGNRLGGSLIGGGLGAVAGAALEQGTDRCRKLLKKYSGREQYTRAPQRQYRQAPAPRYAPQYRQAPAQQYRRAPVQHAQYPTGWNGGYYYPAYYYPQQAPTVTTVVIQSQPVTTTTTTTTIEEEVYYTKPKYVAKKKRWKPAKKVWKPRPKPAPTLKGCQQERCYYD